MNLDVERVIAGLKSPNSDIRQQASYELGNLAPGSDVDISPLISAAKDHDPDVRFWALTALGSVYQRLDEILPILATGLNDKQFGNRQVAILSLANYAEFATSFLPNVVQLLDDGNEFVRSSVLSAIHRFPNLTRSVLDQIFAKLNDDSAPVREEAAVAIKLLGPRATVLRSEIVKFIEQHPAAQEVAQLEAALDFLTYFRQSSFDAILVDLASNSEADVLRAMDCASYHSDAPDSLVDRIEEQLDYPVFERQLAASKAVRQLAKTNSRLRNTLEARLMSGRWSGSGPEAMIAANVLMAVEVMRRASN